MIQAEDSHCQMLANFSRYTPEMSSFELSDCSERLAHVHYKLTVTLHSRMRGSCGVNGEQKAQPAVCRTLASVNGYQGSTYIPP